MSFSHQKSTKFHELHHSDEILILGNAWDVVSARILERQGYKAIGTSSAGIASVLGYPDGEMMSITENCEMIHRISEAVDIPVSADIESGYGESAGEILQSVRQTILAGAVGINLEDSRNHVLISIERMVERIKVIKNLCTEMNSPLFLNVRTDALLDGASTEAIGESIERGSCYTEAGADGIFVPDMGDLDKAGIGQLVKELAAPLNIIIGDSSTSIEELEQLGVARVSFGPRVMRAMLSYMTEITSEVIQSGTFVKLKRRSLSYDKLNELLLRKIEPPGSPSIKSNVESTVYPPRYS
jgi:2-methylisocitrate lyase-like PEP mutase family enzyme